jgi:hypothetical protein
LATGTYSGISRAIEVVLGEGPGPFTHAAFGDGDISASGLVFIDSYDSECGSYMSQAVNVDPSTNATYANTNGNVGSNEDIALSEQAIIFGNATPGPDGSLSTEPSSYISGSTASSSEERELDIPSYDPPAGTPSALTSSATLDNSDHQYRYSEIRLSSSETLTLDGNITLFIDGDIKLAGQAKIVITDGSNVTLRHGSGKIDLSGQGVINETQKPTSFFIYSSSTSVVKIAGQGDFHGAVYAPGADVLLSGQGNIFGAIVGNTVSSSGQGTLHYDEALGRWNENPSYEAKSWRHYNP